MNVSILITGLLCLYTITSEAADCDCDYHSGGCSISDPAPRGFKCKCSYKGFWTCSGVAFPCSDSENCPGGRADYCACKLGGGDCDAYDNKDGDCKSKNTVGGIHDNDADCDCDYHPGGCSIKTAAPEGYKCVCVYKGAWTCSGWAQACGQSEYCPGGLYTYCGCKQGGGDCDAYPEADSNPHCDYTKPAPRTCDCNRNSDWTSSKYKITDVVYDLSNINKGNPRPEVLGVQNIPNAARETQSIEFEVSRGVTTSSTFEHTAGIAITTGVQFEGGIPLTGTVTASIEVERSYQFTWGETKEIELGFSHKFICNGGPQQHTRCEVSIQRANIAVPYTMTLEHKEIANCECTSKGIWRGVDAYNSQLRAYKVRNCHVLTADKKSCSS